MLRLKVVARGSLKYQSAPVAVSVMNAPCTVTLFMFRAAPALKVALGTAVLTFCWMELPQSCALVAKPT